MARRDDQEEAVNADSFLDIVASVVSVLIIMVMMTGLRIKHAPADAPMSNAMAQTVAEMKQLVGEERLLRKDVVTLAKQTEETQDEAGRREHERNTLAMAVANLQNAVNVKDAQPTSAPPDREVQNKIIAAQTKLDMLRQQKMAVDSAPSPTKKVDNYPSPIGRDVDGREIHFQLRRHRLAYVPFDDLVEAAMNDAVRRRDTLHERGELSNTIPPQNGFRMTYTFKLHERSAENARETGRTGMQLEDRVVLTPVSDDIGEPIDLALGQQSQFRAVLADRRARGATITLWVYPDSFEEFRKVKKELYRIGFPVAARPLPEGAPISGSSTGTKSTAE